MRAARSSTQRAISGWVRIQRRSSLTRAHDVGGHLRGRDRLLLHDPDDLVVGLSGAGFGSTLASASGRLRWLVKMSVRTHPGQSTLTPTPVPSSSISAASVSEIVTTRVLRRVVRADARRRGEPGHRRGVHDVALRLREQVGEEGLDPVDDAPQVHAEDPGPVVHRRVGDAPTAAHPGVVAHDVHGTVLGEHRRTELGHLVERAHVAADAEHPELGATRPRAGAPPRRR